MKYYWCVFAVIYIFLIATFIQDVFAIQKIDRESAKIVEKLMTQLHESGQPLCQ